LRCWLVNRNLGGFSETPSYFESVERDAVSYRLPKADSLMIYPFIFLGEVFVPFFFFNYRVSLARPNIPDTPSLIFFVRGRFFSPPAILWSDHCHPPCHQSLLKLFFAYSSAGFSSSYSSTLATILPSPNVENRMLVSVFSPHSPLFCFPVPLVPPSLSVGRDSLVLPPLGPLPRSACVRSLRRFLGLSSFF